MKISVTNHIDKIFYDIQKSLTDKTEKSTEEIKSTLASIEAISLKHLRVDSQLAATAICFAKIAYFSRQLKDNLVKCENIHKSMQNHITNQTQFNKKTILKD